MQLFLLPFLIFKNLQLRRHITVTMLTVIQAAILITTIITMLKLYMKVPLTNLAKTRRYFAKMFNLSKRITNILLSNHYKDVKLEDYYSGITFSKIPDLNFIPTTTMFPEAEFKKE